MTDRRLIRDGGLLLYDAAFLEPAVAASLFQHLIDSAPWRQERGRLGPFPRLTAWYAEGGLSYSYSGVTHVAEPWTPPLADLKTRLEQVCNARFNSALVNRYRDGRDSMGWHADNERELGSNPTIASVSLGATRRFRLKHLASGETLNFDLSDGSLLVMAGTTQHHWHHCVPKTAKPVGERINLTFRWMEAQPAAA